MRETANKSSSQSFRTKTTKGGRSVPQRGAPRRRSAGNVDVDVDDEVAALKSIVMQHRVLKPSALVQWLRFKTAEFRMYDQIVKASDIGFTTKKDSLKKFLANGQDYTLVLTIPVLDAVTGEILEEMAQLASEMNSVKNKTRNKTPSKTANKRRGRYFDSDGSTEDISYRDGSSATNNRNRKKI